jgi:hypothetical protein
MAGWQCYSFKGISIDPRVTTFSVRNFDNLAGNAPPNLALEFTERLKDKMRNETRLQLRNEDAEVEFSGEVVGFTVIPVAPQPGEVVSLNQLVVTLRVRAENNKEEEITWPAEREFKHFAEFSNQTDLLTVQDQLVRQIGDQLLEDIFNHFFNNW